MTKKKLTLTDTIKLGKQGVDIMKNDGATAEEAVRRLGITPRDPRTTIPTQQKDILAPYRENMRSLITGDAKNENNHSEPIFTVPKTSNWGLSAVRGAAQPGFKGNDPKNDAQALYKYMDVETFDKLNQEVFPTIQKIYNDEYVTPLELDRLKRIVNNNSEKLKAYQNYYDLYGGTDLTELGNLYSSVQNDLPDITEHYKGISDEKQYENRKKDAVEIAKLQNTTAKELEGKKGVAYTTYDGYQIKWEDLYNASKAKETAKRALETYDVEKDGVFDKKAVTYHHWYGDEPKDENGELNYAVHLYNLYNGDKTAFQFDKNQELNSFGALDASEGRYLTDKEIQIFNTLYKNEGEDAAFEYVDYLKSELRQREIKSQNAFWAEMAKESPVFTSIFGLGTNLVNNVMAIPLTATDLIDGEINPDDPMWDSRRMVNVMKGSVEGNIDSDVGKFVYRNGMNIAENLINTAISGGNKLVSGILTGSGAAVDTMLDAKNRGLSDEKAITLGVISGVAEGFFESESMEAFLGGGKITQKGWKYIVNNITTEAKGELATQFTNDVADYLIAQDLNNINLAIDKYKSQGLSETEAVKNIVFDKLIEYADIAGSAVFSSAVMASGNAAINKIGHNQYMTRVGENALRNPYITKQIISTGVKNNVPEAVEIVNAMAKGEILTAREMGKTIEKVISNSVTNDGGMMNIMNLVSAIEGRDSSYIGSVEAVDTAKALMNFVRGKATDVDKAIISRSDGATTLLTAIESDQKAWSSIKDAAIKELKPTTKEINTETKYSAENVTVSDGDVYTRDGKKISITKDADIVNGIVVSGEQKRFKEKNAKGYIVVEKWATELNKPVKFIKGLYDQNGNMLDGVETAEGIFINTEAKNPIKWAATHEFSHTMKKSAGETWTKYQSYVIDQLKKNGTYYKLFEAKSKAYNTDNVAYLNEEIAADYIGETFNSVDELAKFIKENRDLANRVRVVYYKALDKLGLLDEKKKAQLMWRDAYRKAVLNVKEGKVEKSGKSEPRFSMQRIVGQNGDYGIGVYLDSNILTGKSESERIAAVKNYVKSIGGREFIAYDDSGKPTPIRIAEHSKRYKNIKGNNVRVTKDLTSYLKNEVKQEAVILIDELIETATPKETSPSKYSHDWLDDNGKNDWDYWRVIIQEKNKTVWEATLNIANTTNGEKVLYDIFPIEMVEQAVTSATSTTNNTVSQNNPTVKSENKKSISGTRLEDIENLASSAGVDLDKAIKKGITTQEFKKAALDIRKEFDSKIKQAELTKDLTDLYTFAQSDKATPEIINQIASNIADKVVNNVTKTVTNGEYADLLKQIKDTKIMVPEAERADFKDGYESFRKGNVGKLNLVNDGLDLDVFWDELTEQYPNLFDENILGSEERLERILEVRDTFSPKEQIVFETNDEIQSAKDKITDTILEKIVKVPATKEAENIGKFVESVEQKLDLTNKKTTRAGIDSDYNYLSQMVRNPIDAKHVPEDLRPVVARLLNCFNYETKHIEKLRAEGKEMDSPTAVRIDSMYNAYTDIIKKSWGVEATEDSQFADKFLSDDIKEMIGEIPANEDGGFKRLEDMTIDELRAMAKVLHSVKHMITQRNKAFNSAIKENISELGFNAAEDFKTIRSRRKGSGEKLDYNTTAIQKASRIIDKYFNYDNVQPWDFFHGMGGTMERLYMEERRAFNRHILNIKSASETISKATTGMDLNKLTGKGAEKVWFETDMGEKIRLSKGQILSLYALYGRKQGKEHILGGGIVLGTEAKDSTGEKISAHTAHTVTEADMGRLFEEHIAEDEKAMVSQIVDFMSKECAKWGNETSMKLYGYEKFGENWYFPIKVSKVTLNQFSGKKGEGNQRTQSFTKSTTKNASNAVEIGDFFDTVTSHINGVSLYNTTALPMLDMERVLNYTESGTNTKVRADIIRTFGKNANSYIDKFHNDENGSTKTERSGLEKLANLNKKASIGFNVRVLVQQPTSIARAYMFLSPKDIPKSFKGVKMIKEMREVCPIAYWKSLGFRDIGTGSTMKDVLINNESLYSKLEMGGYGLADDLTWGIIYGAVKNETKRLNPDLKVGSKEFNDKVRDRFDYIVDRTQVVDSVFHRTQSMRSDNYLTKTTTMFMSESLKTYNLYRTEMIDAAREGRKFKTAARATAVFAASNLLLALAQALPDAWREDDEKELFDKKGNPIGYWDMYWKKFKENLRDNVNPLSSFPVIKDVWSMIQGFKSERIEYSRLNDFIISCQNLGNDKMSLPAKMISFTTSAAAVFGISVGNLKRDAFGFIETIFRATGDEYKDYLIDKFKHNVKNDDNKAKFMRHYERAMANGHADDAAMILEDYMAEAFDGKDFKNEHTEAVTKEALNLLGKTDYDSKLLYSLPSEKFSLDGKETEIPDKDYPEFVEGYYNTMYNLAHEMVTDKRYSELSDKDKVRSFGDIKEYAKAAQLSEMFEGYDLSGWKEEVYDGDTKFMDSVLERVADREFSDKKESYLEGLNFDESKYSEAELGIVEDVENKWAGYKASKDLGREIDESMYRHIMVYEDKLSDKMPLEEYAGVRAYAKTEAATWDEDGSETNLSSKELQNYLDSTDYSWEVKGALFMSIGNSNWYNKYTGLKNNGEPYKGKGGNKSGSSNGRTSKTTTRSTGSRTTTSTRTNSKTTTRATRTTTIRSNR